MGPAQGGTKPRWRRQQRGAPGAVPALLDSPTVTQSWGILWLLPEPWKFWHRGVKTALLAPRCHPHTCCGCPRFFRATNLPSAGAHELLPLLVPPALTAILRPAGFICHSRSFLFFFSILLLFDFLPPAWILGEKGLWFRRRPVQQAVTARLHLAPLLMRPGCSAFPFVSISGLWRRCGRGRRNGTAWLFAVISWGLFRELGMPWKMRRAVSSRDGAARVQLATLAPHIALARRHPRGVPSSPEQPVPMLVYPQPYSQVEPTPGSDHTMRAASGGEDTEPPDPVWHRPRHPPRCAQPAPHPLSPSVVPPASPTQNVIPGAFKAAFCFFFFPCYM